jgi:RNA polymerase sigma-70 factor (ECF subfamily)
MAGEAAGDPESERTRERELARSCAAGDVAAQHELVRRFSALVWSLCLRAGLPDAEAQDVSQEVFWRVFQALPGFRGESRLSTWISTVALRRIVDHRRSRARRDVAVGAPSDPGFPLPAQPASSSPENDANLSQRRQLVAYYLGEMPVMAIARILRMPEGTVKTHLHRGRQTLRDHLRDLC